MRCKGVLLFLHNKTLSEWSIVIPGGTVAPEKTDAWRARAITLGLGFFLEIVDGIRGFGLFVITRSIAIGCLF